MHENILCRVTTYDTAIILISMDVLLAAAVCSLCRITFEFSYECIYLFELSFLPKMLQEDAL